MDTVSACLKELRARRARIDNAIQSLTELQTGHETTVESLVEPQPQVTAPGKKAKRSRRGRPRKDAPKTNGMSAALTCMQCSPPREFTTALGLAQHKTWRHTGRKGQERSLTSSTLNQ